MRTTRRYGLVVLLAMVATIGIPAPAHATTAAIGPNQHYLGYVNNKHVGAVIYVVCPGPAGGTRTGPPAGNQTVAVRKVLSGGGYTGSFAHEIWALFGDDQIHVVGFTSYPQTRPYESWNWHDEYGDAPRSQSLQE